MRLSGEFATPVDPGRMFDHLRSSADTCPVELSILVAGRTIDIDASLQLVRDDTDTRFLLWEFDSTGAVGTAQVRIDAVGMGSVALVDLDFDVSGPLAGYSPAVLADALQRILSRAAGAIDETLQVQEQLVQRARPVDTGDPDTDRLRSLDHARWPWPAAISFGFGVVVGAVGARRS